MASDPVSEVMAAESQRSREARAERERRYERTREGMDRVARDLDRMMTGEGPVVRNREAGMLGVASLEYQLIAHALGYSAGALRLSDGTIIVRIGCTTQTLESWRRKLAVGLFNLPSEYRALEPFLAFVEAALAGPAEKKIDPQPAAELPF